MAAWVHCAGGPNWFGGQAADLGEYTGPWPLMPTAILDQFPANGNEIDFILGFPNPADPTNPYVALDGTYDSQIWGAYRYRDDTAAANDSFIGWYTGTSSGTPPSPDGLTPAPAGVHIYVVAYFGSYPYTTPPPYAPESYLPTNYSAQGIATVQTLPGHWTADQPPIPGTGSVLAGTVGGGVFTGDGFEQVNDDSVDVTPIAETARADLIAAIAWDGSSGGRFTAEVNTFAAKAPPLGFGEPGYTQASVQAVFCIQAMAKYPAPTSFTLPNPVRTFVFDVDNGEQPFTGNLYEYTSPAEQTAWDDFIFTTATWYHNRAENGASTDMSAAWRIQPVPALYVPSNGTLATGTDLADIPGGGPGTPTDSGPDLPSTLTMTPGDFAVLATPAFYFDGVTTAQFPNVASPMAYGLATRCDFPDRLGYTWQTGTWRYWTPNTIGPAAPRESYLRMTQRNDSLGIFQHPRLSSASNLPNRATSVQQPHAPRLPQNPNTYS